MIANKSQLGVGLIEVMVALVLLAISVLGFSTLQMQAVKATDESMARSSAVSSIRTLSEDVRFNLSIKSVYFNQVSGVWNATVASAGANAVTVSQYCAQVEAFGPTDCIVNTCTPNQQAQYNAYQSMQAICDAQMMMNAIACPQGNNDDKTFVPPTDPLPKLCLVASWNKTLPEIEPENGNSSTACIDANGAYKRGASCLVMETY